MHVVDGDGEGGPRHMHAGDGIEKWGKYNIIYGSWYKVNIE
jgi:hypothetical protein